MSGEVTAIKAVTDVLPDAGALTTMSGEVTAIKAVTDALPTATAIGTTFWIKKTMISSNILESAAVDITSVSSGGELAVEEVVVKTDSTGLAAATNLEIKSDNANGELNFFVETIANLGASKTVDLDNASVTGERTVIESGKKLQVHATVTDCTGDGTIDIYIKFSRLAAGATIAVL